MKNFFGIVVALLVATTIANANAQNTEEISLPNQQNVSQLQLVSKKWRGDFVPVVNGQTSSDSVLKRYKLVMNWHKNAPLLGQDHTEKIRKDGYIDKTPLQADEMYMTPDYPVQGPMYFASKKGFVNGHSIDEVVVQKEPILICRWESRDGETVGVATRSFYWVRCHGICRNEYPTIAVKDSFTTVKLPAPEVREVVSTTLVTETVTNNSVQTECVVTDPKPKARVFNPQNWTVQHKPATYRQRDSDIYVRSSSRRRPAAKTPPTKQCEGTPPTLDDGPIITPPPVTTGPNNQEHDPRVPGGGPWVF